MKTVIMAGGKGTRISELFPDLPKPLIPIMSADGITKPVLEWEIEHLAVQGFTDIILTVSHMHETIEEYFGDGNRLNVHIKYYIEHSPLGNAGALFKMRQELGTDSFLLLNADSIFDIDFRRMVEWHKNKEALVTLFTHPNNHPFDSGLIISDSSDVVQAWLTKEDIRPLFYKNRVNAGLHVINPKVLDMVNIDPELIGTEDENGKIRKVDLDRQILKPLCGSGLMYAYDSPEYVKDMGTPERFKQVCCDFQNGIVEERNLTKPQKAIFLDRDGTINQFVGFLRRPEELELIDGVAEAIKQINNSGYLTIVITNQPVIARGEVSIPELQEIHNKLETLLGEQGAYIDRLYFCPHHPDKGFKGEIPELKYACSCRKPKPGLIYKASQDFNIDLNSSWMIGDGEVDIRAGIAAGCRTILISNDNPDYGQERTCSSLLDAVSLILN